jgi:hypothetical protein
VTVAGVSPLALYEFRAKLVRRNAMPLSPSAGAETAPSEERFGPATPPVLKEQAEAWKRSIDVAREEAAAKGEK